MALMALHMDLLVTVVVIVGEYYMNGGDWFVIGGSKNASLRQNWLVLGA